MIWRRHSNSDMDDLRRDMNAAVKGFNDRLVALENRVAEADIEPLRVGRLNLMIFHRDFRPKVTIKEAVIALMTHLGVELGRTEATPPITTIAKIARKKK